MKTKLNLGIVSALLFIITAITVGYFYTQNFNKIYMYVGLFVCGTFLTTTIAFLINYKQRKKIKLLDNKLEMWNTITYRVKKAGETAFNKMPLGILVFNDQFVIEWANSYAKEMFQSVLVERSIENLSEDLSKKLENHIAEFSLDLYGKVYHCINLLADNVLYFYEITNETRVIEKYKQRTAAIGILNLDNLDESMSTLDAQTKAQTMSQLIRYLTEWSQKYNVCLKGYSEERYLLIMDYETLSKLTLEKFSIIETIKKYCDQIELRITVSIGIACDDHSAVDLLNLATEQLNLALQRGGNQAVVFSDGKATYFGAQGEAFESRTQPQVRAKTEEFLDTLAKYKEVFIIAHKSMDVDAFSACIAAVKLCDSLKKQSYIVFDEDLVDTTVKHLYREIENSHSELNNKFLKPNQATNLINQDSLLVIVDCQYNYLLLDEKVYKRAKHVAIIDHHRRKAEAIGNFEYSYVAASSSSSVEMIIEMLEFVDNKSYTIAPNEATWMIMGIVVDTNNFMIHTTSRTFSVLSKLQAYGGEMARVQKYLREDVDIYNKKINAIKKLEIIDGYGIVACDDDIYERSFMAKVADDVISVNSIKAAFCIGRFSSTGISISARSLDEENVQMIMEKLGGGGHYTTAATQIYNSTIPEVKKQLLDILNEKSKEEGEKNMKVILIKDVKGKGKANDILDIPMGHANYLIRSGLAKEANPENLRQLENNLAQEKAKEEKFLADMKDLKVKIEAMTVTVKVKVGANGKLFGSVSTKAIVEKFKEQNDIDLDKRKLMLENDIDALGTYEIPIQLHKEVTAKITLYVVEEGAK